MCHFLKESHDFKENQRRFSQYVKRILLLDISQQKEECVGNEPTSDRDNYYRIKCLAKPFENRRKDYDKMS